MCSLMTLLEFIIVKFNIYIVARLRIHLTSLSLFNRIRVGILPYYQWFCFYGCHKFDIITQFLELSLFNFKTLIFNFSQILHLPYYIKSRVYDYK